ncbi:DUF2161 domain-containing phosphodiesterase [Aestuariivirga litoralis]|uniref:DUF2161 domain-containing phosphodiesterase n=1 Tax=Aestuariivirga litoralis TaxID=2650924 RepID=UPI0018C7969E|nr:DUF2161 family putative PD-(D/E)XK-type phosphodiesterase [Aestuariivirga litoralis]MBG1230841.1 hypothetical protein [Aestuariivirga litoralis]
MKETDLYPPIKRFLESQGYTVKAEIKSCDVMALRGDDPPVIVELKTGLTLQLFYQAVDRLAVTDAVYIAVARPKRGVTLDALRLTKRLGLGLIVVAKSGSIEVLADPAPYTPRKNSARKSALLKEFSRRHGDPNLGGSAKTKLMTAYKQDALRCLAHLHTHGPTKISELKKQTNVDRSATILRNDYYGWFFKHDRGVYAVTEQGIAAVTQFQREITNLLPAPE